MIDIQKQVYIVIREDYSRVKLFWSLPSLSKLLEMVKDRETWRSAVHEVAESDLTERVNNNQV